MHAWQIVRIYFESKGRKRLMSLKSLMDEIGPASRSQQTPSQLRAALTILSRQYRIPLRKVGAPRG